MTHTPGPWRYEAPTKTIRSVPANYWLATLDSWDGAVNHEANASLIAAAPDLLANLQTMRNLAAMLLNRQHAGLPIADRIWSDLYSATNSASAALDGANGTNK